MWLGAVVAVKIFCLFVIVVVIFVAGVVVVIVVVVVFVVVVVVVALLLWRLAASLRLAMFDAAVVLTGFLFPTAPVLSFRNAVLLFARWTPVHPITPPAHTHTHTHLSLSATLTIRCPFQK